MATEQPQGEKDTVGSEIQCPAPQPEQMKKDSKENTEDDEVYSIYRHKAKALIVLTASVTGFLSPISSSIYFPALSTVAADLHVSDTLINLTVTSYMIFQGLAPAFFATLADNAGRRPAYILCFILYIAANIGLALQREYAGLFVLRCLQSAGSSSTIALASAVVADLVTSAERGVYVGYAAAGGIFGPSVGPVIGGLLTHFLGWPSVFWFLAIFSSALFVPLLLFLPETARKVVGNGSRTPPVWGMTLPQIYSQRQKHKDIDTGTANGNETNTALPPNTATRINFPSPFKILAIVFDKEVSLILLGNSLVFANYYAVATSITSQCKKLYSFNDVQIGLCFIPVGFGSLVAAYTQGRAADWNYARHARKLGITVSKTHRHDHNSDTSQFPLERARVEVILPLIVLAGFSIIAYGWVLHYATNLAGPLVLLLFVGYTTSATFNIMSVLMVDIYPESPATATAATNLTRCLLGAGFSAAIVPLINGAGRGWAFTLLGFLCFLCVPALLVVSKWGPGWRKERLRREEERRAALQGREV